MKGLILNTDGKSTKNYARVMQEISEFIRCETYTDKQRTIENKERFFITILEYDKNNTGLTTDI